MNQCGYCLAELDGSIEVTVSRCGYEYCTSCYNILRDNDPEFNKIESSSINEIMEYVDSEEQEN